MSAVIGLGMQVNSVLEFNRRALCALKSVVFRNPIDANIAADLVFLLENGHALWEAKQQKLYGLIHRYRKEITDTLVTEYAALKAKGADA